MKLGFGAEVTEYIGEFDLVINKTIYNIHKKTKLGSKALKKSHNEWDFFIYTYLTKEQKYLAHLTIWWE